MQYQVTTIGTQSNPSRTLIIEAHDAIISAECAEFVDTHGKIVAAFSHYHSVTLVPTDAS